MKTKTIEEKLTDLIEAGRVNVELKLFKQWKLAKDTEEREALSAQMKALGKLTLDVIKSIREQEHG